VVTRYAPPVEPPAPPYPDSVRGFEITWSTDLTFLFGASLGGSPLNLACYDENDGAVDDGDDEMFFVRFATDLAVFRVNRYLGDFDAGSFVSLDPLVFGTAGTELLPFFDHVTFQLREIDGGTFGPDDPMRQTLPALPRWLVERRGVLRFTDATGSGLYGLTYQIAHGVDR
jgi:hypothetical protein